MFQAPIYARSAVMSAAAAPSTSNAATESTEAPKEKEATTQLGALEEDDEFEEFPAQGS